MSRVALLLALAWVGLTPLLARADKPNRFPRPTVFLQGAGQFITQTADPQATLYDLSGNPVLVFQTRTDFASIELSADERFVRLSGRESHVFDVATGSETSAAAFTPVVAPQNQAFQLTE